MSKSYQSTNYQSKSYHIVVSKNGWIIKGSPSNKLFKTQKSAVIAAKEMASKKSLPVIVHSKDGKVTSVSISSNNKVQSANVKRRLDTKKVRNSIAEVGYEHSR